jgi:hypothetical protein
MHREVHRRYEDPLSLVWLHAAREVGLSVERSDEVFASYDGRGRLTLCSEAHYDADDSLAQLLFHELCHALVAGEPALEKRDWGMENVDARDLEQEHACHRVQAALADRHGLRGFFAVTTEHRAYWDALPVDPLAPGRDPSIALARAAFVRATEGPWAGALTRALAATQTLAALVRPLAPEDSLWRCTVALHASGFPCAPELDATCQECAWSYSTGPRLRCRQTRRPGRPGRRVAPDAAACVRFEPRFGAEACASCGACCREAFDLVELGRSEAFARKHPALVRSDAFGSHVPRPDGHCVALEGDGVQDAYRCRHYADRPRSCRDFELAGDACLLARQRVGLSA